MTNEELLQTACERCEEYSPTTSCECKETCPVYELYLATKYEDFGGWQGNCDFDNDPKPEML